MAIPPDLDQFTRDLQRYKEMQERPLSIGETALVVLGAAAIVMVVAYLGMAFLK